MSASEIVYLVRHAKAGERTKWDGDDRDRPLSNKGWRQAEAIAERLVTKGATELYSSPYLRCVETLEPLAARLGTSVHTDERLAEMEPFDDVVELLAEVEHGAVLCTHGDIVPAVIQALHRRGMEVQTPPDWRKATVWVLRRKGERITKGKVWPPPT